MASYIDKDIAVSIVRLCFSEHGKFETHSSLMNYICNSLSADVTTADVKPVVHAHWRRLSDTWCKCSHCGYEMLRSEPRVYCPVCGAIMDEEANNED